MKKIRINLLGIIGAKKTFMGDGVYVKEDCLCIPLDKLYVGEKGIYVDLVAFKRKDEESYIIKQRSPQGMSEEERQQLPIIGSIKE